MDHQPDAWRAFAEGCLRNHYFHERALKRGPKCLGCRRRFSDNSKIQKHHESYIRLCIGGELPQDSGDIYRDATNKEFSRVPDCRRCQAENPAYFQGCLKLVYPMHAACHGRVHENEKRFIDAWREKLISEFTLVSQS